MDANTDTQQNSEELPKHLHVIGICGVAMSAIAIAFKDRGVKVTGSDKGFFPPVSTELEAHEIDFYAGWHPEKMTKHGMPDVIMVGTASGSQNPETAYAKEHNIPMFSYPEILGRYFVKPRSVVCSGTWGKTSSSAMMSFILAYAGLDPTFMFGGISLSHKASAHLSDSDISVFEGDEYKSSPTDPRAKFFHYKPTHLLLTAVSWDHADLYPTEKEYFEAFRKLVAGIPRSGLVVACADHAGVLDIMSGHSGTTVFYGRKGNKRAKYTYRNVTQTKDGIDFVVNDDKQDWKIHSPMLGLYQCENITGCFAMACELGVPAEKVVEAISKFQGLKRRMEKRLEGAVTVIDDIAHSPEKAVSILSTLRAIYHGHITAVFEPNIGGRQYESAGKYDNAFASADTVIIPRLTKLKVAEDGSKPPMEGEDLEKTIQKTFADVRYIDDDAKLVKLLCQAKNGDVIAFLGSHGFRGMIEETITCLRQRLQS